MEEDFLMESQYKEMDDLIKDKIALMSQIK